MIIINFHGLGPVTREIDAGEHACWLDTPQFELILDRIQDNSNVRITFDDGNVSDCEIAMPALLKRGIQAVFFVCSGRIGQDTFLNEAQVRELVANGMTIGSHGVHHIPWRNLDPAELEREVRSSRMAIEQVCGRKVDLAACPFGSYDRRVLAALRRAGYRRVYTSDAGLPAANSWIQARTTLTRRMTLEDVETIVAGNGSRLRNWMLQGKGFCKRIR